MFERINQNVLRKIQLTADELAHFNTFLRPKTLRKREFLQRAGEVTQSVAFVSTGILRSYSIDQKGEEQVMQFAPEDWWISDIYSSLTGKPSQLFVDAMEDSELLLLGNESQEKLYAEIPAFERYFRILAQNRFLTLQERITNALNETAEQKYAYFLEKYPTLQQRIPQHQIASYLGIQPETLSRLRRKKGGKG